MNIFLIVLLLICLILVFSMCNMNISAPIPMPKKEKAEIINEALKYIGYPYGWGGQSYYYEDGTVDCSGFIIDVYKGVLKNTPYKLLFEDTTVKGLYNNYTIPTDNPKQGDLIFMGDEDISHIAIYYKKEGTFIYFIDAYSVTGEVNIRNYDENNIKFKSFAEMEVSIR